MYSVCIIAHPIEKGMPRTANIYYVLATVLQPVLTITKYLHDSPECRLTWGMLIIMKFLFF